MRPHVFDGQSHRPADWTPPPPSYAPASAVRQSHLPPPRRARPRGPQSRYLQPAVPDVLRRNWRPLHHPQRSTDSPAHHPPTALTAAIPSLDELDAAPAELSASSTRQTTASRSSTARTSSTTPDILTPQASRHSRSLPIHRPPDSPSSMKPHHIEALTRAQRGKNCGNGAGDAPYPATGSTPAPGPAPIRAVEGLRAPVAMVVSPRPERAGQADQDGRPSGAALTAIDLSVIRGVGSSMVVPCVHLFLPRSL